MKWLFYPALGLILGGLVGFSQTSGGHSDSAVAMLVDLFAIVAGGVGGLFLGIVISVCDVVESKKRNLEKATKGSTSTSGKTRKWSHGLSRCPQSGVWTVRAKNTHALAKQFNEWHRTFNIAEGNHFPDPSAMLKGIEKRDVRWQLVRPAKEKKIQVAE